MNKKFVLGTFWLTFANLLCKVLGVVYLIPWLSMMGDTTAGNMANALYNVGYLPYGLFLMLGTVGFPNAIAKKVAIASKSGDEEECRKIFQSTLNIMYAIGLLSAVLMYVFAPLIAGNSPVANVSNGITIIRSLCPSLAVIPVLSAIRGFFQGKNDLHPYGTSLILEQVVRVVVILAGTFYLRVLTDGTLLQAVWISTVASLFGGVAAIIQMYYLGRRKNYFSLADFSIKTHSFDKENREVSSSILKETLPFIFVGSVVTIVQILDQVTMKQLMHLFKPGLSGQQLQYLFSQASVNPNKLTMILISLVGTVAVTSLPLLSGLKKWEYQKIEKTISESFSIAFLILLPSMAGMALLAQPLYTLVFGYDADSGGYFQLAIFASLFFALFTILTTMLQSLNNHHYAVVLTCKSILLKLVFQVVFIGIFGGYGMSLASGLAFGITFIQGYLYMCREYQIYPLLEIRSFIARIFFATLVMLVGCLGVFLILNQFLSCTTRVTAAVYCIIIGVIGVAIFIFVGLGKDKLGELGSKLKSK